jgi:hypothetical protein
MSKSGKRYQHTLRERESRRNFLKGALGALTIARVARLSGVPVALWSNYAGAVGSDVPPSFFIHITRAGGADGHWAQSSLYLPDVVGRGDARLAISTSESLPNDANTPGFANATWKFCLRAPMSDGMNISSPNSGGATNHSLGAVWKSVFEGKGLGTDYAIVKGMTLEGDHGTGNYALAQGNGSSYAKSHSAIVAGRTATTAPLPLHYILASDSAANLFINTVMNTGYEVPTCIGSMEQFRAMTGESLSGSRLSRREMVNRTIASLAGKTQLLVQAPNRSVYDIFGSMFQSSVKVGDSNMAGSIRFLYARKRYMVRMKDAVLRLVATSPEAKRRLYDQAGGDGIVSALNNLGSAGELPTAEYATYVSLENQITNALAKNAQANVSGLQQSLAESAARLRPMVTDVDDSRFDQNYFATIRSAAFSYALADYSITSGLTAVADISAPGADAHGANVGADMLVSTLGLACLRELVDTLKATPLAGGAKSYFDQTLILVSTEFDRDPVLSGDTGAPGTAHGPSSSVILAGGRIRGGLVVGDIFNGPAHANQGFSGGIGAAMPINPATGRIDAGAGGRLISQYSVFPTVLGAFGCPIPANQITASPTLSCLFV